VYFIGIILTLLGQSPKSFVSTIKLDLEAKTLQIDGQKHPLNYIKKTNSWNARGISQILDHVIVGKGGYVSFIDEC
jgi:hypothetical protein